MCGKAAAPPVVSLPVGSGPPDAPPTSTAPLRSEPSSKCRINLYAAGAVGRAAESFMQQPAEHSGALSLQEADFSRFVPAEGTRRYEQPAETPGLRSRHPNRPGDPRPPGGVDDHDLHPYAPPPAREVFAAHWTLYDEYRGRRVGFGSRNGPRSLHRYPLAGRGILGSARPPPPWSATISGLEWRGSATMTKRWNTATLRGFQEAAQSLKLYRRADLHDPDEGTSLIDELYVDPLAEEQVFRTVLKPHTTFVVGRKGTGKSTIFQRLQSELRKTRHQTSAYVDIKTVYESSQVDPALLARLQQVGSALPQASLEKLLLYKEFLRAVIVEIKSELRKRIESSVWERLKERFTGSFSELFEGLDILLEEADEERFISVLGIQALDVRNKQSASDGRESKRGVGGELSEAPKLSIDASDTETAASAREREVQYSDILLRTINIKEFISRLKAILERLGIRNLYVLIDDFSELPEEAMRVVVDVLLAPLNNWSDEFVKFKVAAYPGRIYFGAIDKSKIDEVYLDLYRLYGGGDVSRMEENATQFTRRLVESRIKHFCKVPASEFFERDDDELWQQMFFATMANPRILGYLLHYMYESRLINGRPISVTAVQEAARRFYDEKIEPYFAMGKFLHETFAERASIFSLKELVEAIVTRAKELRTHESEVIKKIKGRPPTSHFHVPVEYEPLFSTLELNFFLTKYFEMSDRSGRKVTIFALNYGLCQKYSIRFGRPVGEREFRLYLVERIFDYTAILRAFLERNQEISCPVCRHRYSFEHLDALRFFGMLCKECKQGTVQVENLSQKYEAELRAVSRDLLLPPTELGILQTLHTEAGPLRPAFVAGELDCSYQLIGKRAKALAERGLVKRYLNDQGNRLLEIEPTAEDAYFSAAQREELDVPQGD
jgi:Cdc6-like AAA superfamily ATPase